MTLRHDINAALRSAATDAMKSCDTDFIRSNEFFGMKERPVAAQRAA